jgi:hypothetical protein
MTAESDYAVVVIDIASEGFVRCTDHQNGEKGQSLEEPIPP